MTLRRRQPGSLEQVRRHNLHLVLRSVYSGAAQSRAELAGVTGLTKPTVSTLVGELLAAGLISERGLGRSSDAGGKRPTLLSFEPRARQVIGVSVVGHRALGALSDLAGETSALHVRELAPSDDALAEELAAVADVVAALLPQLDAPLLGVGVGLPGSAGSLSPAGPVAAALERRFGVPLYLGNQAELSALGQLAYAEGVVQGGTLVNLIVDGGVEMGVGMAGGALHYGSDLGELRFPGAGADVPLRDRLSWSATRGRVEAALATDGDRPAAGERAGAAPDRAAPSYLRLRSAANAGNRAAARLIDELARDLAPVLAWLVATVRPTQVSLGGRLSDLGEPFLVSLRRHAAAVLPVAQLADVALSLAYSDQLGAMGAVALVVQAELELLTP